MLKVNKIPKNYRSAFLEYVAIRFLDEISNKNYQSILDTSYTTLSKIIAENKDLYVKYKNDFMKEIYGN